uniref:TNase-like domain-containing protein n=1 Tax=viral metagenome TaxID=1070528 RepID=A0A6C0E6L6_9ZZZZ
MKFGLFNCFRSSKKDRSIKTQNRSVVDVDLDLGVIDDLSDETNEKNNKIKFAANDLSHEILDKNVSVDFFNLDNKKYSAKCVKCYDGDTIHLIFKYPDNETGKLWKWRCRISGIDTPEIKSLNTQEKELATTARDCLTSLILNKNVIAHAHGFDKYGRLLVDVYVNVDGSQINVSEYLINKGYARPYFGGTKSDWSI